MKSDTERKKYYTEKLHRKKSRLHVHLSKELRAQLRVKKRAVLVRTGDTVRVMRGPEKGKEAKVASVNVVRRKVFLEGVAVTNSRGKDAPLALEPSNLLLIGLESSKQRKEIFSDEAFRKKEIAKPKAETPKTATASQTTAPATPQTTTTTKAGETAKQATAAPQTPTTKTSESPKSGEAQKVGGAGEARTVGGVSGAGEARAGGSASNVSGAGAAKADAKRNVQANMPHTTQKIR